MKSLYQTFCAILRDNDCERQFDRALYTQCRQFWKDLDDKWWKKYLGRP